MLMVYSPYLNTTDTLCNWSLSVNSPAGTNLLGGSGGQPGGGGYRHPQGFAGQILKGVTKIIKRIIFSQRGMI